nr:hypothetical protein [Anaerolineae bacterium]
MTQAGPPRWRTGAGWPVLLGGGRWDRGEAENRRLLTEAGLIYVGGGDTLRLVRALRGSPALAGIAEAFARRAVIVGMSAGAAAMGAWVADRDGPGEGEPGENLR